MNPERRRPTGALEAEVMACLWARPDGATPRDVLDDLGGQLVYTTVMNVLVRLWQKGLVSRQRDGKAFVYRAEVEEPELAARRMRAQLDGTRDRSAALSRFVDELTNDDAAALRRLLEELDGEP